MAAAHRYLRQISAAAGDRIRLHVADLDGRQVNLSLDPWTNPVGEVWFGVEMR